MGAAILTMGMTRAILPLQGCLVTLAKFSSIQSKTKINTYTLQRRKEYDNTTLAKEKAEIKFKGEMKQLTADGQIHSCSLKHCGKTIVSNGDKCGKRPCTEVESPYKILYTSGSLVLSDGYRGFEVVPTLVWHFCFSCVFHKVYYYSNQWASLWQKNQTKLLLQKRTSKYVEFKLNSSSAGQVSGIMTEDLNSIFLWVLSLNLRKKTHLNQTQN